MTGLYEVSIEAAGVLDFAVAGRSFVDGTVIAREGGVRIALPLVAGWHHFSLGVANPGKEFPRVVLAGPETSFLLGGRKVRHDRN